MASVWGGDDPSVAWGQNSWQSNTITQSLTGQSLTTALGTLAYSAATDGWGRDAWGDNNWGENEITVSLTGVSAAASLPYVTWGYQTWGEDGYGGVFYLNPADVMGLTGVSATGTVGSPVARSDYTESLTGQAMASAVGSIIVEEGVPLTGLSATATVGSPVARGDYTESLSGLELEIDVGAPNVTTNPIVQPTGLSLTSTAGAISPTEQTMGLTGVSATVTLSPIGVAPIGWGRVTAEQTGNYTQVTATQTGNWTKITKGD